MWALTIGTTYIYSMFVDLGNRLERSMYQTNVLTAPSRVTMAPNLRKKRNKQTYNQEEAAAAAAAFVEKTRTTWGPTSTRFPHRHPHLRPRSRLLSRPQKRNANRRKQRRGHLLPGLLLTPTSWISLRRRSRRWSASCNAAALCSAVRNERVLPPTHAQEARSHARQVRTVSGANASRSLLARQRHQKTWRICLAFRLPRRNVISMTMT